jgi:hypothetical protein
MEALDFYTFAAIVATLAIPPSVFADGDHVGCRQMYKIAAGIEDGGLPGRSPHKWLYGLEKGEDIWPKNWLEAVVNEHAIEILLRK